VLFSRLWWFPCGWRVLKLPYGTRTRESPVAPGPPPFWYSSHHILSPFHQQDQLDISARSHPESSRARSTPVPCLCPCPFHPALSPSRHGAWASPAWDQGTKGEQHLLNLTASIDPHPAGTHYFPLRIHSYIKPHHQLSSLFSLPSPPPTGPSTLLTIIIISTP
jgi:hypothetical protein